MDTIDLYFVLEAHIEGIMGIPSGLASNEYACYALFNLVKAVCISCIS